MPTDEEAFRETRRRLVGLSRWLGWGIAVLGGAVAVLIDSRVLLMASLVFCVVVVIGTRIYVIRLRRAALGHGSDSE